MIEKLIPDMYYENIYKINYKKLLKKGIKCILFDLDNTIAPVKNHEISKEIKELFFKLKEMGFKLIIVSNSPKKRIEPFKNALEVDASALSMKPSKKKYIKILNTFNFTENEVAAIGDQLLTDILGANNMHLTSILVDPISKDGKATIFNRFIEKRIMNKFEKKDLFTKGKYYE